MQAHTIRDIYLENSDMNLYVSCGWDKQFHTSATQINLYTSVENTASAFSVSSGSGGSALVVVSHAVAEVLVLSKENSTQALKV